MSTYGAIRELVVEYELGAARELVEMDDDPQEQGRRDVYVCEVRYILRHPSGGCWADHEKANVNNEICPIQEQFDAVGMLDAIGVEQWRRLQRVVVHLEEGLYHLQCWAEHYSTPEGDDWDGGVYVDRVEQEKPLPPKEKARWTLVQGSSSPASERPERPESSTPSS
jgi:hypothetical protein